MKKVTNSPGDIRSGGGSFGADAGGGRSSGAGGDAGTASTADIRSATEVRNTADNGGNADAAGYTLERWLAREREVRLLLAAPGKVSPSEIAASSGLEFLRRLERGELPSAPIGSTLDFVLVEIDTGRTVFQGTPKPEHYNPIGSVHGGYIATLLDSAVGCAVQTCVEKGFGYTTLELKVNYVRALTDKTGPVRAEGRVVNVSRQIGIAEGRLTDAAGRLYAYASTTCLIFPLPPANG